MGDFALEVQLRKLQEAIDRPRQTRRDSHDDTRKPQRDSHDDTKFEPFVSPQERALAARRLSGGLGRKISPDEIRYANGHGIVELADGTVYSLAGGNRVYIGDGKWMRNGKAVELP